VVIEGQVEEEVEGGQRVESDLYVNVRLGVTSQTRMGKVW
jgi:hypothetical protein